MKDFLRKVFVENAALKAVSLVLSVTLFIVVRGEKDVQIGAAMRVVYTMPDDRVMVSDSVDQVRMIVRGPWSRIKRFDERDLDPIHIDLREHKAGIFRFESDLVHGMPPGLQVVSFSPPSVELRFEGLGKSEVPISVPTDGEPGYGYEVTKIVPMPARMEVKGPEGEIGTLKGVATRPVSVQGATAPFTIEVPLASLPRNFEAVNVRQIKVRVEIGPKQDVVTREAVPVAVTGLTVRDGETAPKEVTIVLRGPRLALDAVDFNAMRAMVEATREDDEKDGDRPKRVNVSGLPAGVAFEVKPAEVVLRTHKKPPTP